MPRCKAISAGQRKPVKFISANTMSSAPGGSDRLEYNSAESWERARALAALMGEVPASFSTCTRLLLQDHEKKLPVPSSSSKYHISRLTKGQGIVSLLYYAALTFYEDQVNASASLSSNDLTGFFSPADLAAIFGFAYYYRRAKKLSAEDEWEYISTPVQRNLELGGLTGIAIPDLGLWQGIIIGGVPSLAFTCFHLHHKKLFTEYRRHLKMKSLPFDHAEEMKRWSCTSVQVASILLQSIGFGVAFANSFLKGLSPDCKQDHLDNDPAALKCRIMHQWIRTLDKTGKSLAQDIAGEFHPAPGKIEKLLAEAGNVRNNESKYRWLEKGRENISEEATPKLFKGKGAKKAATEIVETDIPAEELPAAVEAQAEGDAAEETPPEAEQKQE